MATTVFEERAEHCRVRHAAPNLSQVPPYQSSLRSPWLLTVIDVGYDFTVKKTRR